MPIGTSAGIQSLEIGIALFKVLHAFGRPVGLAELASSANLHPSKAHRYLASLVRSGLATRDARGTYSSGPLVREWSTSRRDTALEVATQRLVALGRTVEDTVFVARWKDRGPVVVTVVESERPISMRPASNGRELPLWNSATSRVFLAAMAARDACALLDEEVASAVAGGIPLVDAVARRDACLEHLATTRRHGLARTTGERQKGLASLSAPIHDTTGRVTLAVTVIGVAATLDARWNGRAAAALRDFAGAVTRDSGGNAPGRTSTGA